MRPPNGPADQGRFRLWPEARRGSPAKSRSKDHESGVGPSAPDGGGRLRRGYRSQGSGAGGQLARGRWRDGKRTSEPRGDSAVNVVADALWAAGWPVRICLLGLVRGYRLTVGQLTGGNCRFYPSCSEYAEAAISQSGAARGLLLSAWRILRCSPLSKGGVDRPPAGRLLRLYDGAIQRTSVQGTGE
jgi:uncharacterized protein